MGDEQSRNLTGVWHGLFTYPDGFPEDPGSFVATLLELGPSLSGTTHEEGIHHDGTVGTLFAMIDGEREGTAVYFDKTYDGTGGWDHLVRYQGALNADWTEIEGRWAVPGVWSGRFLMIRSGAKTLAQARAAFARA